MRDLSDFANRITREPKFGHTISVTKTASPSSGAPSTIVNFTITVTNNGQTGLNPVKIVDTLPVGMSYVSSSPAADSQVSSTVTWNNVGPISASGSKTIYLITHIDAGASGTLINTVNATGKPTIGDNVSDEVYEEVTVLVPPNITSSAPESPVNDTYCTWTKFNVSVDRTVNVTWYLNETAQTPVNESVIEANYTFHAEYIGEHNVSAVAENANGTDMQTWVWNVTAAPQTYNCTCGDICVNTTGWWRDGGAFNASGTRIQAAVNAAAAGETIYVWNGSYTENVNVNEQVTLAGEGADVVNVTNSTANNHVFTVTTDYVNISGFNVGGATGSGKAGIYLNGADYCNISDNNASNNNRGIYLYSSSNNTLTNNIADLNKYGILLSTSSNNTLTNNTADSNTDYGIYLTSLSNNTLTNNTADSNNYGIYLSTSSNNTLTNNTADSNNYGIYLCSSSNNTLTNNTANSNNHRGICLYSSSNNTLTNNTANSNNRGIYLHSSSDNTLANNTANSNSNGIYLYSSSNNTIYNNHFNNTNNAYDDGNNTWNTTPTPGTNIFGDSWLGGNYWSDYAGADENGDGLGDTLTPYNSSGNTQYGGDYHPLTTPDFAAPNITSSAPESPVNDTYCTWTKFNVSVDRTVNVTWYLNETAQTPVNESVIEANYTFHAEYIGEHNVSAVAENANGIDMQTWVWNVTKETTSPVITIDAPTQSSPANRTGGEQFWVNFTYTELYPANYTVTVGNATAVINSTTNPSVAGGTGMTANESFNLNASAADGWYNVTVEMYDNSLNYNITHQNNSVEKGSYNAAISQPENQTTEPSVNATYELNITNTGSFAGTFTLAVTNHGGADVAVLNETTIANLASGSSRNVTLNVTDASAGTYNVTVNVTSDDSGLEVAETGYIMTTVVGPTLALGNVTAITSDWGRDFSVNHSVAVTSATAEGVNVTYNVSWITGNSTMGTIAKDGAKWHNQTLSNSTVQNIAVMVNANTTTGSATNDSETFQVNITRRDIVITSQPKSTQSVGTDATFWINASARDEHSEAFTCKADLIKDGIIANTADVVSGNANFSTDESAAGTYNFSIRFYNTSHYNNESTSNSTVTVSGPILSLGNVNNIASDWGINFSVNHSVAVTSATAEGVNVTYNVSWITDDTTMGTIAKDGAKWHNQTLSNSTVQNIAVMVNANTTTASATNDTGTFSINITRRAIIISAQPPASQTTNPNSTFWVNASARDEHEDTLICKADLIREGVIIDNQTVTDGNANFSRTEPAEGTFNFSVRFYNTTHYNNASTSNATMHIADDTPPASVTGLDNLTTEQSRIRWEWTDPADADFAEVMIYLDGTFKTNVSKDIRNYTATGLDPDTNYTIGTHTVDDKGNINQTWVNDTARTLPSSELQRINVTPTQQTLNITESANFTAAGFDQNNNSIDQANLTFAWHTTPSGIGTLNTTTGSAVAFTALHAGRTEIYAVNGSVSSNETYSVLITVNTPPATGGIANGTGNATSGNSTAIVQLTNTSINGTIIIEEIGYPLNETEVNGSRTLIGTGTQSVKGVNVTVNGSIAAALNGTGGYVHIRIEYNESQLGTIDEDTLYIYKFINGTGWLKMVKDANPDYCTANGRNTTANHVWANVTNCSIFMLAGTPTVTPSDDNANNNGDDGTYPPNWGGGGFALPDATPTPTPTQAAASNASVVTQTPPAERTTPATIATETRTTAPAAGATPTKPKQGLPGFTAAFAGCGVLAVAYAMMRRREWRRE